MFHQVETRSGLHRVVLYARKAVVVGELPELGALRTRVSEKLLRHFGFFQTVVVTGVCAVMIRRGIDAHLRHQQRKVEPFRKHLPRRRTARACRRPRVESHRADVLQCFGIGCGFQYELVGVPRTGGVAQQHPGLEAEFAEVRADAFDGFQMGLRRESDVNADVGFVEREKVGLDGIFALGI